MSDVFRSEREDGRFVETAGFYHAYLKNLQPRLRFDPHMDRGDFDPWRERVREKLSELMFFPEMGKSPEPQKLWTQPREGYQLEKWEAYPEPYCVVPFYQLVPEGVSAASPAPAVICISGSAATKENLAGEPAIGEMETPDTRKWLDNRMAYHYARNGFVALAFDSPATHEQDSSLADRNTVALASLWMGRSYESVSTFQKVQVLHWLVEQPWVDRERVAVSGHSLGAKPADIMALLYPNLIKAVVHNDCLISWQERQVAMNLLERPAYQIVPGIFQWFDYPDIQAALAPCPLLFTEGGRPAQIEKVKQAYALVGATDHMEHYQYDHYADPSSRKLDQVEMPEGIDMDQFFEYAYINASEHRFRHWHAVPWLRKVFSLSG